MIKTRIKVYNTGNSTRWVPQVKTFFWWTDLCSAHYCDNMKGAELVICQYRIRAGQQIEYITYPQEQGSLND